MAEFNWGAAAAAGGQGAVGLISDPGATQFLTKSGRKLKKLERRMLKQAAINRLLNVQGEIRLRESEDPREQAGLKQSMFARGLGKSTISEQDTARLTSFQRERMARLRREESAAHTYLKYLKKRKKFEKRTKWLRAVGALWSVALGGYAAGSQSAAPGASSSASSGGGGMASTGFSSPESSPYGY